MSARTTVDLPDDAARAAVRTRLDETLFVEAGAGTGKTTVLVERIVELVTAEDAVPMRVVAAITFTEKAAAELRDRVRGELEKRSRSDATPQVVRDRCRQALEELDEAAICTLHSFAQRILTAFPVEAGLPPRIEVRDEVSSLLAFDDRWRRTRDDLLDDPELESATLIVLAAGANLEHLRRVAEELDDNWDLLDRIELSPALPVLDIEAFLSELDALCAMGDHCSQATDKLLGYLGGIEEFADQLRAAIDDADRIERLLADKPTFKASNIGAQANWPDVRAVQAKIKELGEQRTEIGGAVINAALRQVVSFLAHRTALHAAERRHAGELEFHDLLVLARAVLRDNENGPAVRARLRDRYERLLIDEFQDTDPIQVEIAALLAAPADEESGVGWEHLEVTPGRVFFVGDPKQSIYRFRRADIATFLAARDRFSNEPVRLTSNFRSTEPVLAWINHVFAQLIQPEPGSQPEYFALDPIRPKAPKGPGVLLLGVDPLEKGLAAEPVREREAASVAAAVRAAIDEEWQVGDGNDGWRKRAARRYLHSPARADVALFPRACARRGRSFVSRRDELARLRHARGPGPSHGLARDRRPERPARARELPTLVVVRLRRRRSVPVPRGSPRPVQPAARGPGFAPHR